MKAEEIAAQKLLEALFQANVDSNAVCFPGDDPPDLVCQTTDCRFAIKVTFSNQQERIAGENKMRRETDVPLMEFGETLGKETKDARKRNYLLILHGPPQGTRYGRWKSRITKEVSRFVESADAGVLELQGASISASEPGNQWTVAIAPRENATTPSGALNADIQANIEDMLRHALSVKSSIVGPLTGYNRKALLLWNTYFFGDDIQDVIRALETVMQENPCYAVFDIVLYVTQGQLHLLYGQDRL